MTRVKFFRAGRMGLAPDQSVPVSGVVEGLEREATVGERDLDAGYHPLYLFKL